MFRELTIDGFRGFDHFKLHDLGKVNLLVGTNNCGKTSVLEAIHLLSAAGDYTAFWAGASRRGEKVSDAGSARPYSTEMEIRHFFHGHEITDGSHFQISAKGTSSHFKLNAAVVSRDQQQELPFEQESPDADDARAFNSRRLALELVWSNGQDEKMSLPISARGGVSSDSLRRAARSQAVESMPVNFITTAGMLAEDVIAMYEDILLTEEEERVLEALRTIEPAIERLAPRGSERRRQSFVERGGIVVKLRDVKTPIPIGSMGDGIWRILGLALALVSSRNGVLLIDEIDTGLHFTVMEKMWHLVKRASMRFGVQVFATTHSRDCYESVAAISRKSAIEESEVSIQRLEREKKRSVAFTEREIVIAAERGTEVR